MIEIKINWNEIIYNWHRYIREIPNGKPIKDDVINNCHTIPDFIDFNRDRCLWDDPNIDLWKSRMMYCWCKKCTPQCNWISNFY